jgi:hypothetical protein
VSRVKGAILRDHFQASRWIMLVMASVPHIEVKVAAYAKAVQRVGEENPLIFHLENAAGEPCVVFIVLPPEEVSHSKVVNDVGGGGGGVLEPLNVLHPRRLAGGDTGVEEGGRHAHSKRLCGHVGALCLAVGRDDPECAKEKNQQVL